MRILVVSNLYPPVSPGVGEWRCQAISEALQLRGHAVQVLTSNFGITREERGSEVERRLRLNGAFGVPAVTDFKGMRAIEWHNQRVLAETIEQFRPELLFIWSLRGLSKGLVLAARRLRIPVVYDVADDWMITDLQSDPWLRWWNSARMPLKVQWQRRMLEWTGQRDKLEREIPTRATAVGGPGAQFFDGAAGGGEGGEVPGGFDFARIYFCSEYLRDRARRAGLRVDHAEIIRPGVATEAYFAEPRPATTPTRQLLICTPLVKESGVLTALTAVRQVCANGIKLTATVCGKGPSDHVALLRSFVIEHRLPVEFVNHAPRSRESVQLFRTADVFLHPEEWPEPCVLTPLEAMAAGQAVIGSTAGGGAEIFRHGENALAFEPGDAAAMAECIRSLVASPQLRHTLAETGQTEVVSRYNEVANADRVENYLRESLESGKGA